MAEVRVQWEGLDDLLRLLEKVDGQAKDISPVFRGKIDKSVTMMFRRQFQSEGAFGGRRWPPLTPASAGSKASAGFGGMPTLQRTRRLWGSFVKSGGSESVRRITPHSYERGSSVPYAAVHQGGGRFAVRSPAPAAPLSFSVPTAIAGARVSRRHVPARPIVPEPVPRHLRRTWARVIGKYVLEGDS